MVNYNNGKIYKLICDNSDLIYIGSSTQPLYKRLNQHKKRNECSSKKLFELGNVKIILIEEVKCENKEQLLKCEQYYIDKYKNNIINTINAYTDQKDYYINNKDKILNRQKDYDNKNKDKINKKKKEYYNNNKDKKKEKFKEYYINNKNKILNQKKEYKNNNKDKIKIQKKNLYQYQKFMDGFTKIDPYLFLI
jgi:hypothetical protein